MTDDAFFTHDGTAYHPQAMARGPWAAESLHGRVVIGLAGHALERAEGGAAWMPARLTVDMYRLPNFSRIPAKITVVRGGKRIKLVDCELIQEGKSVARGTCQFLIRSENAPGKTV